MEWIKRLRTSYGFGVHSPFAFSLITDTLRLRGPYAYYAYHTLSDPTARLIYRVAVRLNVAKIDNFGTGYPLPDFTASSRPGLPFALEESYSPTLYVIAPGADITSLPQALKPGDSVLLIEPEHSALRIMNQILETVGYGMSFNAVRGFVSSLSDSAPLPYTLFCLLPHLPKQ